MKILKTIILDEISKEYERCEYDDDIRAGLCEVFRGDQIFIRANYNNGKLNGKYESFFETGQISTRCSFKEDMYDGEYVSWWENGNRKESGYYSFGKKLANMNGSIKREIK